MSLQLASFNKTPRRSRGVFVVVVAWVCLLTGGYLALTSLAPQLFMHQLLSEWSRPVAHEKSKLTENRLYIPDIKLNIEYRTGDEHVLSDYAWHRYPERGDPEKGGNFILAGHRFQLGMNPGETIRKSPFYAIDQLKPGAMIFIDFNSLRYQYKITEHFTVNANQTGVEAPSENAKLTLYSCDLFNPKQIREVIEASLVKKDIDPEMQF